MQSPIQPQINSMQPQYMHPPIPKVLYQCYKNKKYIPNKVYKNISKFANEYRHEVWDDDECYNYMLTTWGEKFAKIYQNLQVPAHKADLWRYCILYERGGIYMDIKMELIEPIEQTLARTNDAHFSTILSVIKDTIMQGLIIYVKGHPILKKCIDFIVENHEKIHGENYLIVTQDMHTNIRNHCNVAALQEGLTSDVFLFKEICTSNANDCIDGLDRYKKCCYVTNHSKKVLKTRYSDYPWLGSK